MTGLLYRRDQAGQEVDWYERLIALMIDRPELHELAGTSDRDEVRKKVDLGTHPVSGGFLGYTRDELEDRRLFVLVAADPEESLTAANPDHYTPEVFGQGNGTVTIRLQLLESEYNDPELRRDRFNWFWDRTSEFQLQLKNDTLGDNGTRLRGSAFVRSVSPQFSPIEDESSQGVHLATEFAVAWGENA